jgi:hypothetical protein
MTRDDIREIARVADIDWHRNWNDDGTNKLEVFAALVADAAATEEREAGFEIEQPSDGHNVSGDNACLERFAALVAAEREACAQLVDHLLCEGGGTYGDAIRRRSE